MRHTSHAVLAKTLDGVRERGSIDTTHWREVDLVAFVSTGAVRLVDGDITIRRGRDEGSDAEAVSEAETQKLPSDLKRFRHGWALV